MLLVDDDALVRAGLKMILSSAEDLEAVGEADVVLMDIRKARMDGIAAKDTHP